MSWLSSGLKKIGKSKITRGIGKAVDFGADFLPPGFRDVGNLGGKLMQGQNLKKAALGTALDYAGGTLARGLGSKLSKVGGGVAAKAGIGGVSKSVSAGVPMVGPYGMKIPTNAGAANDIGSRIGGGILGGLKKIGGEYVKSKGGAGGVVGDIIGGIKGIGVDGALGGAALGMGALQTKKASDMRNKALKLTEGEYAERAPLRKLGLSGLMNEQRPDLSGVFQSQNPFRRVG